MSLLGPGRTRGLEGGEAELWSPTAGAVGKAGRGASSQGVHCVHLLLVTLCLLQESVGVFEF